jgi:hypothetical protein
VRHTSAYVSIRQHTSAGGGTRLSEPLGLNGGEAVEVGSRGQEHVVVHCQPIRQHTSAYVSIRQHTSAYVSIRQHTSAYVSIRMRMQVGSRGEGRSRYTSMHTSEYVSIRQHTHAHEEWTSIRSTYRSTVYQYQHTSAYVSSMRSRYSSMRSRYSSMRSRYRGVRGPTKACGRQV